MAVILCSMENIGLIGICYMHAQCYKQIWDGGTLVSFVRTNAPYLLLQQIHRLGKPVNLCMWQRINEAVLIIDSGYIISRQNAMIDKLIRNKLLFKNIGGITRS